MIRLNLTPAECDAVLRAIELVRVVDVAHNRRERPGDLRHEEAVETKIRAALGTRAGGDRR